MADVLRLQKDYENGCGLGCVELIVSMELEASCRKALQLCSTMRTAAAQGVMF